MVAAFTLAFKMLAEADSVQFSINVRMAGLMNVPLPQFNLMEVKFLEALLFDASVDTDTLSQKVSAM